MIFGKEIIFKTESLTKIFKKIEKQGLVIDFL